MIKPFRFAFFWAAISLIGACSAPPQGRGEPEEVLDNHSTPVVFRNVQVLPMDREEWLHNQTVVVSQGRITAMGGAETPIPERALIVDGKGKYLIPGLAEMHAHVPPNDDTASHRDVIELFVTHGITNIRGMLGHPLHLDLREKLRKGELIGPRLQTSGPSFSGGSVKTAEQGRERVREQKAAGYDFLKIHPGLNVENFLAIADEAQRQGIRPAGHVPYDVGIQRAIDAKYTTVDHLDGIVEYLVPEAQLPPEKEAGLFGMYIWDRADTSRLRPLLEKLRDNGVWVVPTQALAERWIAATRNAESYLQDPHMKYMPQKTLEGWARTKTNMASNPAYDSAKIAGYLELRRLIIRECHRLGVGMLLGCDAPQVFNVPGISTHQELEYLVQAGLTPYQALRTGTANVGAFYGMADEMGVLKPGAISDLILLEANPLEDIRNTTRIAGVMAGRHWLSGSVISKMLKTLEKN